MPESFGSSRCGITQVPVGDAEKLFSKRTPRKRVSQILFLCRNFSQDDYVLSPRSDVIGMPSA